MKLFKGSTRLFDKAETELSTSTPTIRKAKILGLQDVNQLVDVDLKIKAATTGNSGSAKIELYKSDDTLLGSYDIITKSSEGVVSTTLPSGWTSIDNIYTLRFNGEKFILVTGTSSGDGTLYLSRKILDLARTSSREEITTAFGNLNNIKAFRKAVEEHSTNICITEESLPGTNLIFGGRFSVVSSSYRKLNSLSDYSFVTYYDPENEEDGYYSSDILYKEIYTIEVEYKSATVLNENHITKRKIISFGQSRSGLDDETYFTHCVVSTFELSGTTDTRLKNLVVNDLITVDNKKALSATQGKNLKDMLDRYFGYNDDDPTGYEYYPNHFRKIWNISTVTADVQESFRLANLNLISGDVITKLEGYYDFGYNGRLSMNFTNPTVTGGSNYLYLAAGADPIITYRAHFAGTNLRITMEWERKGGTN